MYLHKYNRSSSIIRKLIIKLLQRQDTYAFYIYSLFLTFFKQTCVYSNLLFNLSSSNTTFNLIVFFFFCIRLIVISKNYQKDISNCSNNNINFNNKNF